MFTNANSFVRRAAFASPSHHRPLTTCRHRVSGLAVALALVWGCGTSPSASNDDLGADAGPPTADALADGVSTDAESDGSVDAEIDAGVDTAESDIGGDTPDGGLPDLGPLPPAMGCDAPEVAWSVLEENWWLDVSFIGLSPDNGVVLRGQMIQEGLPVLRSSDGVFLGVRVHDDVVDLSADGAVEAARVGQDIEIRDRESGAVLSVATPFSANSGLKRLELSPSGNVVGVLECQQPDGEATGIEIRVLSNTGDDLNSWTVRTESEFGCIGWADHNAHAFDVGERTVIAAEPGSGVVHVFDIVSGERRSVEAHELVPNERFGANIAVIDVQLHPDGREFATVGEDGWLRRWDVASLDLVEDPVATSPIRLNGQTFTTGFSAAPVAYSPNGNALAYVGEDGAVRVTDLRSGAPIASAPAASEPGEQLPDGRPVTGVAAMGFSADSRSLVIVETGATQLLSCGSTARAEASPGLTVQAAAAPLDNGTWPVTIDATTATGFAALDLTIDGVQSWLRGGSREQVLWFTEPGDHEVVITLSDGIESVSETLFLTTP